MIAGIERRKLPAESLRLLETNDLSYRVLSGKEREDCMVGMLQRLDSGKMSVAGKEKQGLWEQGWGENLRNFIAQGGDLDELVPKYYRPFQPCRLRGEFVQGNDRNLEYHFFKALRAYIFSEYAKDADTVYEFGCGPGHNLAALAQLYPQKRLYGFDWAATAVELVNRIADCKKFDLHGIAFDMFHPDEGIVIERERSLLLTMGALEQTDNDFGAFLDFIVRKKPALCVHVEPLRELYDKDTLFDYLALKHHDQRKLLGNFIARLKEYERRGEAKIETVQKVDFGGWMEDGWSYVVWRPL
jgi:SAM-dependent methyltransferase